MKLYSTRGQSPVVSFREALFAGQAPDGGLYMPVDFPSMPIEAIAAENDFRAAAATAVAQWLGDELTHEGVRYVTEKAFFFQPELQPLSNEVNVLELFHGPTLSFKDFGAQFMAKSMGWFLRNENREITILVATSGDTGSAVAHAFHRVEGIRIVLLYPSGKVSPLQERQFTTLGDNVHALEVDGTFDDCQALVKTAFRDAELTAEARLSSANSINIGRLIPQSLYYLWAVTRFAGEAPVVCVPSGNFGNLCAGLFAEQCGLGVHRFIAAVNANAVIPEYLETGVLRPRPSLQTLSNAMDVGNPSNWERIRTLYGDDRSRIAARLWSTSISDDETLATIRRVYEQDGYLADPHTAVGLAATQRYRVAEKDARRAIVLSTAHPAKFLEVMAKAVEAPVPLPPALEACLNRPKIAEPLPNDYKALKEFIRYVN
ncbi:MAG: threonine synthase [candidate division KSB1 bacterium]|nr:threonine synthase [candidate division KSB1 bacterium]